MIRMFFYLLILSFLCSCSSENDAEILGDPFIAYFNNDADSIGAIITIYGHDFSKYPERNIVSFNAAETSAFFSDGNIIKVIVPKNAISGTLSVKVYSKYCSSLDTFYVATGRWRKKSPIPIGRFEAVGFSINNFGYISMGQGTGFKISDLWEYDPINDTWTKKSDFIGSARSNSFSFCIDDKAYIGSGYNLPCDLYEYYPNSDTWTQKAIMSDRSANLKGVAFSLNQKGYVIMQLFNTEVHEYNPLDDSWIQKENLPAMITPTGVSFVLGDKGYISIKNGGGSLTVKEFWEYDPIHDRWTYKTTLPIDIGYSPVGFSIDNKAYIMNAYGNSKKVFEYDPNSNSWVRKVNFPGNSLGDASSFVINNRAFIVGGYINNDVTNEVWEFIP